MLKTLAALFAFAAGSFLAQPLPNEARLQQEIKKYEAIVADSPRDIEMWHELAGVYRTAEMWDKAIEAESQAIKLHPKYAVAFYGRGKAKMSKQDYVGACDDFSASIRLFELRGGLDLYLTLEQPSDSYIDSYRSRGVALAHLDRYNEGIADLAIALRLHKDDPRLLYEKGYLEEKAGRKDDAIADYQRSGLIYAEASAKKPAEECAVHLESLGAKSQAAVVRAKLEPKSRNPTFPDMEPRASASGN
jgi:tetratricopeptide (TPR) repeat protein